MERVLGLSISSASNLVIYGEKWQAARHGGAYLQAQCCGYGAGYYTQLKKEIFSKISLLAL